MQIQSVRQRQTIKNLPRRLILHLVLAVFLSAVVFYIFAIGFSSQLDGNNYPVFMATAQSHYAKTQEIPPYWNSRAFACVLSGAWFDFWSPSRQNWIAGRATFAGFHTLWVFALFILMAFALKNAWLPMLGTAAGIIGNSFPNWPPYFMPWDMMAMLFFTAAYLCYRHKRWILLIATIFAGAFVKETILLCAFFFLGAPWKLREKIAVVIGIPALATLLIKIMLPLGTSPAWYYSITGWFSHLSTDAILDCTIVFFANAGGLLVLLFCLTRTQDWPLRIVALAFIVGQCLNNIRYETYEEFRVWCELLPLGWIMLGDFISKKPKL